MRRLSVVAHSLAYGVHFIRRQLDQAERFCDFARHAIHRRSPERHAGPTDGGAICRLRNAIANRRPSEQIPATLNVGHPKAVPAIGPNRSQLTRDHQLPRSLELASDAITGQCRRQVCVGITHLDFSHARWRLARPARSSKELGVMFLRA